MTRAEKFKKVFGYAPAKDEVVCNASDWCGETSQCAYCTSNSEATGRPEDWWDTEYESNFEKSMVEMTKRANDFVHEKRSEGITVIPAREFFEAIGIIDFFFGNDVGIDISNFKGDEE